MQKPPIMQRNQYQKKSKASEELKSEDLVSDSSLGQGFVCDKFSDFS